MCMSEDERKQLLELYIEAELARKIQELKDTGGFDSDKQVIIRAIENYHERMKFNQEQQLAVQEPILDKGVITVGDDEIGRAIKFLKERPTSNELEYSEITKFYGNYNIGLINSFYNRLLPVKYALLVLLKLHLEKES